MPIKHYFDCVAIISDHASVSIGKTRTNGRCFLIRLVSFITSFKFYPSQNLFSKFTKTFLEKYRRKIESRYILAISKKKNTSISNAICNAKFLTERHKNEIGCWSFFSYIFNNFMKLNKFYCLKKSLLLGKILLKITVSCSNMKISFTIIWKRLDVQMQMERIIISHIIGFA